MIWRALQLVITPLANLGKDRAARVAVLGGAFSLLCLSVLLGVSKLCVYAYDAAQYKLAQTLDWRVNEVVVSGADHLDVNEVLEQNGLQVGALLADVKWNRIRDDLARNPMLTGASIIRLSPEHVVVQLEPRRPIARLDRTGERPDTILVDRIGTKIRVMGRASDKDLIALSGKGAFATIDDFWPLLMAEPDLFARVAEAQYIGERRWDLILKGGAVVQLPEHDTGLALSRLAKMMRAGQLDPEGVISVDMRTGERLFLRNKPESMALDVQTTRQG